MRATDARGGGDVLSAAEVGARVAAGELTSEELVTDCLERITAREDVLHAWAHLDPEVALAQARARDREAPRAPLHGVPIAVKDIIDTADMPTECGSPIHAGRRPERDATCVARLREAGAVIVGKTVTTEFAQFAPGPTTNPHDPTRTPGGSSSGSAAAVAAATVPLALGTQTAGSIVRPAAFCGVVGVKPTFAAVPTDGVWPCAPSLDTVGVLAGSVADAALCLAAMADVPDRLRPAERAAVRVGVVRGGVWGPLDADGARAFDTAVATVAAAAEVREVGLPGVFDGLVDAQSTIMDVECARSLAGERRQHPELLSDALRARLDDGAGREPDYDAALDLAHRARGALPEVFRDVDVVLTPAVLGAAPPIATTGDPLLCRAWTLLGTPAIAVPGLSGDRGLPLGVQVVAPPGGDDLALAGAALVADLLDGGVGEPG